MRYAIGTKRPLNPGTGIGLGVSRRARVHALEIVERNQDRLEPRSRALCGNQCAGKVWGRGERGRGEPGFTREETAEMITCALCAGRLES